MTLVFRNTRAAIERAMRYACTPEYHREMHVAATGDSRLSLESLQDFEYDDRDVRVRDFVECVYVMVRDAEDRIKSFSADNKNGDDARRLLEFATRESLGTVLQQASEHNLAKHVCDTVLDLASRFGHSSVENFKERIHIVSESRSRAAMAMVALHTLLTSLIDRELTAPPHVACVITALKETRMFINGMFLPDSPDTEFLTSADDGRKTVVGFNSVTSDNLAPIRNLVRVLSDSIGGLTPLAAANVPVCDMNAMLYE